MARIIAYLTILALASAFTLAACSSGDAELEKITYMAGYKPQANLTNVGAYVAVENGYFEDQGLEVEIRHTTTGEHLPLLMSGDIDFTTVDANNLLEKRADPGLPIVAIGLLGQRGQQAYVSLSDSGFQSPTDWEGHTFGYKFTIPPDYLAIIEAEGVDRSKIEEVSVGFDPRILTEGKVDLLAVFKSNEPNAIRGLGFDVTVFDAADYGVPTLGLTYITRQQIIDDRPETAERFLMAVMKGVEFANDPDSIEDTLDIVMKYAPDEDREHMRFMLTTELADAVSPLTDANGLGWMTRQQWQAVHDYLIEYGALAESQDVEAAFTTQFLERIYEDGELK